MVHYKYKINQRGLNILRYNNIWPTILITILSSFLQALMSYSLSFLQVNHIGQLFYRLLLVSFIYFLFSVVLYLKLRLQTNMIVGIDKELKGQMNRWLSHKSYSDYHEQDYSDYVSRYIHDIEKVLDLSVKRYLSIIEKVSLAISVLIMLVRIHYSMIFLAFLSLVIMYIAPQYFQAKMSEYNVMESSIKSNYLSKIREYFSGFDAFYENKAMSLFIEKLETQTFNKACFQKNQGNFEAFVSGALTFINSIAMILAISLVSYYVIKGKMGVGNYLAVMSLLPSFGSSILQLFSEKAFYLSGQELFRERLAVIFEEQDEKLLKPSQISSKVNSITLENIRLSYGQKSLTFPQRLFFECGKSYHIIGKNGSGKSSLLRILTGEQEIFDGQFIVNNQKYTEPLLDHIAYVNQVPFLFNETVRENIDLFNQYSDEEIIQVMTRLDLPLRLDMMLEDNGRNISGGQRQKIALARALMRRKQILILDEATSNMDSQSSETIYHYLLDSVDTLIIVDHNLPSSVGQLIEEYIYI